MGIIRRAGGFVGSHMPVVVPCCVVLGVLLPEVFGAFKPVVPFLFAIITFQGSLNTSLRQIVRTFRHPRELIAILVASVVVMPALARLAGGLVFSDFEIVAGIVIEYSIPVAVVSFMWIDMYRGNASLGLAAILLSTVLAPVMLPVTIQLLMGTAVEVDVVSMVKDLAVMVAVPALAGVAVNELTDGWGHETLSPAISPVCRLLAVFVILCNSTGMSAYVLAFDPVVAQVALFILVFALFGFLLGLAVACLMHVPPADLYSMVFCVGLRNISSGAVIAEFFPGAAIIPVMMGTLFQQVLAALVSAVLQRLTDEERERGRKRVLMARFLQRRGVRVETRDGGTR